MATSPDLKSITGGKIDTSRFTSVFVAKDNAAKALAENDKQREADATKLVEALIKEASVTVNTEAVFTRMQEIATLRKKFDDRQAALKAFLGEIDRVIKIYQDCYPESFKAAIVERIESLEKSNEEYNRLTKELEALGGQSSPPKATYIGTVPTGEGVATAS